MMVQCPQPCDSTRMHHHRPVSMHAGMSYRTLGRVNENTLMEHKPALLRAFLSRGEAADVDDAWLLVRPCKQHMAGIAVQPAYGWDCYAFCKKKLVRSWDFTLSMHCLGGGSHSYNQAFSRGFCMKGSIRACRCLLVAGTVQARHACFRKWGEFAAPVCISTGSRLSPPFLHCPGFHVYI